MQKNRLKAALFDLDGVVFDTESQYSVFWGEQCRKYHPEHPGLEHEIKGSTLTQIYDRWFSGDLQQEQTVVTERLNAFEAQMRFEYIEGFEKLIADLHAHGVKDSSGDQLESAQDGERVSPSAWFQNPVRRYSHFGGF